MSSPFNDEAEIQRRLREEKIDKEVARRRMLFGLYPESGFDEGDVVTFQKLSPYGNGKYGNKLLSYAAIYVNRQWWRTGVAGGLLHEDFLTWLFSNPESTPVLIKVHE